MLNGQSGLKLQVDTFLRKGLPWCWLQHIFNDSGMSGVNFAALELVEKKVRTDWALWRAALHCPEWLISCGSAVNFLSYCSHYWLNVMCVLPCRFFGWKKKMQVRTLSWKSVLQYYLWPFIYQILFDITLTFKRAPKTGWSLLVG